VSIIIVTWEAKMERNEFEAHRSPKITRTKWTAVVAQAVECLLCKHEALSSSSSPTKIIIIIMIIIIII
jgi:hypothetical protein